MNRPLAVILAIVAVVIVAGYTAGGLQSNLKQLAVSTIASIDLSEIEDGTYTGTYTALPISAEVHVTVQNHRLTAVELVKHSHGRGAAAEVILDEVLRQQTLGVDAISGATYSSKVILKAIENALTK